MVTTHEQKEQICKLWLEGIKGVPIAKELGLTKGQVMGVVNRAGLLNLPQHARPGEVRAAREMPVPKLTPPKPRVRVAASPKKKLAKVAEIPVVAPAPTVEYTGEECCWPIGNPGEEGFRFCGGRAIKIGIRKYRYCEPHVRMNHERTNPRPPSDKKSQRPRRTSFLIT